MPVRAHHSPRQPAPAARHLKSIGHTGVLLVVVPRLQTLKGIACGASSTGYRDRLDPV